MNLFKSSTCICGVIRPRSNCKPSECVVRVWLDLVKPFTNELHQACRLVTTRSENSSSLILSINSDNKIVDLQSWGGCQCEVEAPAAWQWRLCRLGCYRREAVGGEFDLSLCQRFQKTPEHLYMWLPLCHLRPARISGYVRPMLLVTSIGRCSKQTHCSNCKI